MRRLSLHLAPLSLALACGAATTAQPIAASGGGQTFSGSGDVASVGTSDGNPFNGPDIGQVIDATAFYRLGIRGNGVVLAIVEGGFVSNAHASTSRVTDFITEGGVTPEASEHATQVAAVAAGVHSLAVTDTSSIPLNGIAPGAELWSAAFAEDILDGASFSGATFASVAGTYAAVIRDGVDGRAAQVVNSSWGTTGTAGINAVADLIIDALVIDNPIVAVASAGNRGAPGTVTSPGLGFNSISVGATAGGIEPPFYDERWFLSSFGPENFSAPGMGFTGVYAAVDLVAPGADFAIPSLDGGPEDYESPRSGTSLAAAVVSGAAALVVETGTLAFADNPHATDGRVIRAVLMNSARKLNGWNNGQITRDGIISTTQGLDWQTGTGTLDLGTAVQQYIGDIDDEGMLTGSTTADLEGFNGGSVNSTGWDFGRVEDGQTQYYDITQTILAGETITATLTWFADFDLQLAEENILFDRYANLDLLIFSRSETGDLELIAESVSMFNETEHLHFTLTEDLNLTLGVRGTGEFWDFGLNETSTDFALAWTTQVAQAIPSPGVAGLILLWGLAAARRSRA